MGVDINIRLLKYNENTNLYKEIALYRKSSSHEKYPNDYPEMVKVPVYDGRDYEMFDGMKDGDEIDGYGIFPWCAMRLNSYEEDFRNEMIEKQSNRNLGYFDFYEISLAEMRIYTLEHPQVVDLDAEYNDKSDSKAYKPNPIVALFERIISYISFAEPWGMEDALSDYKVIFYFDC